MRQCRILESKSDAVEKQDIKNQAKLQMEGHELC
jgi:hypothetical protein